MNAQTKPDPSHILEATMNAAHSNHFAPQACHSYSIKGHTEAGTVFVNTQVPVRKPGTVSWSVHKWQFQFSTKTNIIDQLCQYIQVLSEEEKEAKAIISLQINCPRGSFTSPPAQ